MKVLRYLFVATVLLSSCGSSNENSWDIKIINSEHGQITSNVSKAKVGESVVLSIFEEENYLLSSLLVNSVDYISYVDQNTMRFVTQMVEGGLHVKGIFSLDETLYPITISPTSNGTITPSSSSAKIGDTVSFTVKPNEYYFVSSFKVNNIEKKSELTESSDEFIYRTTMVKSGLIIETSFAQSEESFDINISSDIENGVITCDKEKAKIGEELNFYITPSFLYELESLLLGTFNLAGNCDFRPVLINEIDMSSKPYVFTTTMVGGGVYIDGGFSLDVVSSCHTKDISTDYLFNGGSFKIDFSFKNIPDVSYSVNSITLKIIPKNKTIDEQYTYDYELTPQNGETWETDGYFDILIDSILGITINEEIVNIYNYIEFVNSNTGNLTDEEKYRILHPFTFRNMIDEQYWYIEINYSVFSSEGSIINNILVAA